MGLVEGGMLIQNLHVLIVVGQSILPDVLGSLTVLIMLKVGLAICPPSPSGSFEISAGSWTSLDASLRASSFVKRLTEILRLWRTLAVCARALDKDTSLDF